MKLIQCCISVTPQLNTHTHTHTRTLDGRGCLEENTYIYMDESLCCPCEPITTLLISYAQT